MNTPVRLPPVETLNMLFEYDHESGTLVWRKRVSPKVGGGDMAGTVTANGYIRIGYNRAWYLGHRIAWKLFYSEEPPQEIDHINGRRSDNRITNLRAATRLRNSWNSDCVMGAVSKMRGVSWHSEAQKWRARIRVDGKLLSLGLFTNKLDAAEAYQFAKRQRDKYGAVQARVGSRVSPIAWHGERLAARRSR